MKRVIRANNMESNTYPDIWEDVTWKIEWKGFINTYIFKGKANSARGLFIGHVTKVAPYDDAEYYWARVRGNGLVEFIHEGRIVDKLQLPNYLDFEEDYESPAEFFEVEVQDSILEVLVDYNSKIEPRIIHN